MKIDVSIAEFGKELDQEPISFAWNVKCHFVLMIVFFSIILINVNQRKYKSVRHVILQCNICNICKTYNLAI